MFDCSVCCGLSRQALFLLLRISHECSIRLNSGEQTRHSRIMLYFKELCSNSQQHLATDFSVSILSCVPRPIRTRMRQASDFTPMLVLPKNNTVAYHLLMLTTSIQTINLVLPRHLEPVTVFYYIVLGDEVFSYQLKLLHLQLPKDSFGAVGEKLLVSFQLCGL